jgi:hypothetical protein
VALVAPLVATYPLATLGFGAVLLRGTRIGRRVVFGVMVTVAGVALLSSSTQPKQVSCPQSLHRYPLQEAQLKHLHFSHFLNFPLLLFIKSLIPLPLLSWFFA